MEQMRQSILQCLSDYADDDARLVAELNGIIAQGGDVACTVLFHVLTNLDFSAAEARDAWGRVVVHWQGLIGTLGRSVSIRTAVCDYFCSINRALRNPKVIEIHLFEKTDKQSKYDGLTNLFNRFYFDEALERELARAKRHDSSLSLLFIDLDDFKHINDDYGHPFGDRVLQQVARIISDEKRLEDVACRYGGEELVVIIPEAEKMTGLLLGERIRARIEATRFDYDGRFVSLTISGGVVSFPLDGEDGATLIQKADLALYRAKGGGKNSIVLYSENKRRYLRFALNSEVKAKILSREWDGQMSGAGKNISARGILFTSRQHLALGTDLQLAIPLGQEQPLLVIGTVVRVEAFGPEQFDIGVSFLHVPKEAKGELSRCLLRHLGGSGGEEDVPRPVPPISGRRVD